MGHRMELYLSREDAEKVIEISRSFGVDAKIVGRVEESDGKNKVTLTDRGNTFVY